MVSATGPTTAIGIPQKNTGDLLPRKVGDATVEYIQLDDGGDTTRAVQNVKKLIQEYNIDAMIGPSTTPNALAILDVIADAKVPLMATVGTSSVVEPLDAKRRWVFKTTQNDDLIAVGAAQAHDEERREDDRLHRLQRSVRRELVQGVRRAWPRRRASASSASERYARTDQSVTGQALKLMAAKPDAVLIAAVGGPAVLPQATLFDQGYKGRVYQTHAVATDDFIKLGKEKVEGTMLAAGPMLVIDEIPDSNPIEEGRAGLHCRVRKAVRRQAGDVRREHVGRRHPARARDPAGAQGRRSPGPRRSASRCATRSSTSATSSARQGVFNMSATNHNGMDERARVLVVVRDGKFRLLPE